MSKSAQDGKMCITWNGLEIRRLNMCKSVIEIITWQKDLKDEKRESYNRSDEKCEKIQICNFQKKTRPLHPKSIKPFLVNKNINN